jgi:hypothetical protein
MHANLTSPCVQYKTGWRVVENWLANTKEDLLDWEESKWRQKSRAVWLVEGDNNTRYFPNFAKIRNTTNTIYSIKNGDMD